MCYSENYATSEKVPRESETICEGYVHSRVGRQKKRVQVPAEMLAPVTGEVQEQLRQLVQ
jgi:hypothetical protein